MSTFEPFRIRFKLETPVIVSEYGIPLDTLLLNCLKMESGDSALAPMALDELLQKNAAGFYHASNLIFAGVHPKNAMDEVDTLVARSTPKISKPRFESDLCDSKLQPNGKKGKYTRIQLLGGPYKSRLQSYKSYWSRWAVFYGVGDIDRVASLIEFYILTLGDRSSGCFSDVTVERIDADQSLIDKRGYVRRSIPSEISVPHIDGIQVKSDIGQVRLAPPYSEGPLVNGFQPANVMFEYL